jgi:hypothetical protein
MGRPRPEPKAWNGRSGAKSWTEADLRARWREHYATAEVVDVNVKGTKVLVIVGAPFTSKDKLIPPGTADAVTNGSQAP